MKEKRPFSVQFEWVGTPPPRECLDDWEESMTDYDRIQALEAENQLLREEISQTTLDDTYVDNPASESPLVDCMQFQVDSYGSYAPTQRMLIDLRHVCYYTPGVTDSKYFFPVVLHTTNGEEIVIDGEHLPLEIRMKIAAWRHPGR